MLNKFVVVYRCQEWSSGGFGKVVSFDSCGGGYLVLNYTDLDKPLEFAETRFIRPENLREISFDKPQNIWYKLKKAWYSFYQKLSLRIKMILNK